MRRGQEWRSLISAERYCTGCQLLKRCNSGRARFIAACQCMAKTCSDLQEDLNESEYDFNRQVIFNSDICLDTEYHTSA